MKKVINLVFLVSFAFYIAALAVLLFLGSRVFLWSDLSLMEYIKTSSNLVPFKTISIYSKGIIEGSMNMDIPIKNLFGNFIMFLPMGIYLPYLFKKMNNAGVYTISMIILLFSIEVMQLVTRRGSFDIDDFILNMSGALLGYAFWKTVVIRRFRKQVFLND